MDKYELVLDIIEHPDHYGPEELEELLSDQETREIYNILCKVDSAVVSNKEIDVETEWKIFSERHPERSRHSFLRIGNRAASIAAIVCSSIVALSAGLTVTVALLNDDGPATSREERAVENVINVATDSMAVCNDTVFNPVVFEHEQLDEIMRIIGETYSVDVIFSNKEAASLLLYYKFDPSQPLTEVVEQLNTFDQINITYKGNTLIID